MGTPLPMSRTMLETVLSRRIWFATGTSVQPCIAPTSSMHCKVSGVSRPQLGTPVSHLRVANECSTRRLGKRLGGEELDGSRGVTGKVSHGEVVKVDTACWHTGTTSADFVGAQGMHAPDSKRQTVGMGIM